MGGDFHDGWPPRSREGVDESRINGLVDRRKLMVAAQSVSGTRSPVTPQDLKSGHDYG